MSELARKLFSHFSILSLDVVLGVVCVSIFAVDLMQSQPPLAWWFILPATAWVFYTTDHLLDAMKTRDNATNQRHLFHYQNRKILTPITATIAVFIVVINFLTIPFTLVLAGSVIGLFACIYFLLLFVLPSKQKKFIPKELVIAIVYVLGIWFIPLAYGTAYTIESLYIMVIFILLVWIEGCIISWYEFKTDNADNQHSFTTQLGKKNAIFFLKIVLSAVLIMVVFVGIKTDNSLVYNGLIILSVIISGLFALLIWPTFFMKKNRYRFVGESLFFIPGLLFFL